MQQTSVLHTKTKAVFYNLLCNHITEENAHYTHTSSSHANIISDSRLVWAGGSSGHPAHLTVHSITVAHKLLQEYKPAWAACHLHMRTHSSSSSCPRLAFIYVLLFVSSLAFPQSNVGLRVAWQQLAAGSSADTFWSFQQCRGGKYRSRENTLNQVASCL